MPLKLSSYNDEFAHANYAYQILRTHALPGFHEAIDANDAISHGLYENYQSPLYYCVLAAAGKITEVVEVGRLIILGRLLNLIAFVGLLCLFVMIASVLNLDQFVTGAGLVFISLNGVLVRFTSTAGNDPLFWLCSGAILLSCSVLWRDGFSRSWLLVLFVSLVLGLYSKLTTLLFVPLPLVALMRHASSRNALVSLACAISALMLTLPLWMRNLSVFHSLIPIEAGFGVPNADGFSVLATLGYAGRSMIFPWSEFWQGYIGLFLMCVPLFYFAACVILKNSWAILLREPLLLVCLALTMFGFAWLNFRYDQSEGRYFFAAWPVIALAFSARGSATLWMLFLSMLFPYLLFYPIILGA